MAENQNTEWKESWRDEYLKWICGFANTQGGRIFIGMDDDGKVVGLKNSKKLMEDIPNKIRNGVGVLPEVNLHEQDGKEYIEIVVSPSTFPVNYNGAYYFRSGSTLQQMTGIALSDFIMRKSGLRWEDAEVDNISVDDLDNESFKIFRREALRSRRMTREELDIPNEELLQKLHLISNGKLTRAAVLLFYEDPSILQEGSYIKVGKFGKGPDLQYQDTIEGSLIYIADRVVDLIYLKYLKAKITYEHDRRVETYPYPRDGIREGIFNALVHNCYMFGSPIQVRINDKELIISNRCILSPGWTVETLTENHESEPYNPHVAGAFYKAGFIENWGRGVQKIWDACEEMGAPTPEYSLLGTGIRLTFHALESAIITDANETSLGETSGELRESFGRTSEVVREQFGIASEQVYLQMAENPERGLDEIATNLGKSRRAIEMQVKKLRESNVIERIGGTSHDGYWKINPIEAWEKK